MSRGPRAGRDEKGCLETEDGQKGCTVKSQGRTRLARKSAEYSILDAVSAQGQAESSPTH